MSTLLTLPTAPIAPTVRNPRKFLFYSNPKSGKTSVLAGLKNCLIVDLEGGTDFISAIKVDGSSISKLNQIISLLRKGHSYDYIAIDPITRLEDIVLPYAREIYIKTPQGKSFTGDNILHLPNGYGYQYLRMAFFSVLNAFAGVTDRLIITGHVRDKLIEKNPGETISSSEVDLTGKIRSILCADVDAIAFLDRRGSEAYFRFAGGEDVVVGSRPPHLRDCDVLISKLNPDGTIQTFWDDIFLPEGSPLPVRTKRSQSTADLLADLV